jgi:hypothetical protein
MVMFLNMHMDQHTERHKVRERVVLARFAPHQMEKFVIPSTQYASSFGNQLEEPLLICHLQDPN